MHFSTNIIDIDIQFYAIVRCGFRSRARVHRHSFNVCSLRVDVVYGSAPLPNEMRLIRARSGTLCIVNEHMYKHIETNYYYCEYWEL